MTSKPEHTDIFFINICDAPYNADPTGSRNCTDTILSALDYITNITRVAYQRTVRELNALPEDGIHYHERSVENRRVDGTLHCSFCSCLPYVPALYFPEGVYIVSDTLCYRHRDLQNLYGLDLNQQIRILGAGADRTTIRLADNTAGFESGKAKPVISFMPGTHTNVAMSNYCENISINCGRGNPGAVGLDFFANNSGAVRNVKITSGDGYGHAGLQLGHDSFSGILLKHIEIEGFDHGLHVDSASGTMFAHAEDISLHGQRVSGITIGNISLSLRNIRSRNVPAAITCTNPQGLTTIVDSALDGIGPTAIDRRAGFLYASNVETTGFGDAQFIDQLTYPNAIYETQPTSAMPRLPIEETPIWKGTGRCVGVREHGAVGDGMHDDGLAIQRALDNGAAVIRFEPGKYLLNGPVTIPSHVEQIDFSFCDLIAGPDLRTSTDEGFVIAGKEDDSSLFIRRLFAWERWSGEHCTFTHASKRTVCFEDMHTQTLQLYRNTVPGARVFFDNVAITTGALPGTSGHGRCAVALKGQKAWARQLNPERGEPMILNDGGDLVLMGYKSEGRGVVVHTMGGGRTEILGGIINVGLEAQTAFIIEGSEARITTACQNRNLRGCYRTAVETRRHEGSIIIPSTDFPRRGGAETELPRFVIPLYASARQPRDTD